MIEHPHWRVCSTLKDGSMVIQRPHFASQHDCTQYLLSMLHVVAERERVDFIKDYDPRIYPLWGANHGI